MAIAEENCTSWLVCGVQMLEIRDVFTRFSERVESGQAIQAVRIPRALVRVGWPTKKAHARKRGL